MIERLQKYLARAGVASRRHAERLIAEGHVQVNNRTVVELGTKVEPGKDLVTVDGKLVSPQEERAYFLLYKPPGVVTTLDDPQGRPAVGHYVARLGRRVFPVGRLDYDAEGALLLSDDGALAHQIMHPSFEVPRTYLAKVRGEPGEATLEKLRGGVRLEDGIATPKSVEIHEKADKNTWLRLVVAEGRPHLIKRLCAAVGHPVLRLYRPSYAGISVEGLRPGELRPLTADEARILREHASRGAPAGAADVAIKLPPRRHGREIPGLEGVVPTPPPRPAGAPASSRGKAAPPRAKPPGGREDRRWTKGPPGQKSRGAPQETKGPSKGPPRQRPGGPGRRAPSPGAGPRGAGPRGSGPRGSGPRRGGPGRRRP